MSFSNLNLLPQALGIIPPTPFKYRKFLQSEVDEFGQCIAGYSEWTDAYGIVVPAGERMETVEGIQIVRKSVTAFIKGVVLAATHDQASTDQIMFMGRIYNVTAVNDWFGYDDFHSVEAKEVVNIPRVVHKPDDVLTSPADGSEE